MELNQVLIQKVNDDYDTRIIIQTGPITSIDKNIVDSKNLSPEEVKILNDFIEMVDNIATNKKN